MSRVLWATVAHNKIPFLKSAFNNIFQFHFSFQYPFLTFLADVPTYSPPFCAILHASPGFDGNLPPSSPSLRNHFLVTLGSYPLLFLIRSIFCVSRILGSLPFLILFQRSIIYSSRSGLIPNNTLWILCSLFTCLLLLLSVSVSPQPPWLVPHSLLVPPASEAQSKLDVPRFFPIFYCGRVMSQEIRSLDSWRIGCCRHVKLHLELSNSCYQVNSYL